MKMWKVVIPAAVFLLLAGQAAAQTEEEERLREMEAREVEMEEKMSSPLEIFSSSGVEEIGMHIQEIIPGLMGGKAKKRKVKIKEAHEYLLEDEQKRLIDMDQVSRLAVERVEHSGIIFLDEVDKISGRESGRGRGNGHL